MKIKLGKNLITNNSRPLFIAELSCNHCGSFKIAKKIILEAKKNGADFIKFQTYEADSMTINSKKEHFNIKHGLWAGKNLWSLYDKAKTPFAWQKKLFDYSRKKGIQPFSTPYDLKAVKILEKLNCEIYKIASFEVTDEPLILEIAKTKKPIIISTGMANMREIANAIKLIRKYHNKIVILYCVSTYPAKKKDFHLNNIKILKEKFKCHIGLSDHSKDLQVSSLAVAMGAKIFEKHVALEKQNIGYDIKFSLKGKEIGEFSKNINDAWKMISNKNYKISKSQNLMKKYRRSIFIIKNVKKNQIINKKNIFCGRPSVGLQPNMYFKVLGKKFKKNLNIGDPLTYKDYY